MLLYYLICNIISVLPAISSHYYKRVIIWVGVVVCLLEAPLAPLIKAGNVSYQDPPLVMILTHTLSGNVLTFGGEADNGQVDVTFVCPPHGFTADEFTNNIQVTNVTWQLMQGGLQVISGDVTPSLALIQTGVTGKYHCQNGLLITDQPFLEGQYTYNGAVTAPGPGTYTLIVTATDAIGDDMTATYTYTIPSTCTFNLTATQVNTPLFAIPSGVGIIVSGPSVVSFSDNTSNTQSQSLQTGFYNITITGLSSDAKGQYATVTYQGHNYLADPGIFSNSTLDPSQAVFVSVNGSNYFFGTGGATFMCSSGQTVNLNLSFTTRPVFSAP